MSPGNNKQKCHASMSLNGLDGDQVKLSLQCGLPFSLGQLKHYNFGTKNTRKRTNEEEARKYIRVSNGRGTKTDIHFYPAAFDLMIDR